MQRFLGKKILLGICGSIAAYKSIELIRLLKESGAEVQVVMTKSAQDFIGMQTFQAFTGFPVWVDVNDASFEQSMAHIELSRWADLMLIAPATANIMAKLAHGLADDLLSSLVLMSRQPVLICPAMNVHMWENRATQANYHTLNQRGFIFIGPDLGVQVCGDQGMGRMREPEYILNAIEWSHAAGSLLGQRFVLTAGPTREALDPVRYLSNRSTGVLGYLLAEALAFAGAEVELISGPCELPQPPGVHRVLVESAADMHQEVFSCLREGDYFIGVAAVADYQPVQVSTQKLKKQQADVFSFECLPTVDILASVKRAGIAKMVIGFAAETENLLEYARDKLVRKADVIIANLVGKNQGFGLVDSTLMVLTHGTIQELGPASKSCLVGSLLKVLKKILDEEECYDGICTS